MNTEDIKGVIADQQDYFDEAFANKRAIARDVPMLKLNMYLRHPNILAVLGVRRCGKSVLSHMIFSGRSYGYVNFDDERLAGLKTKDLNNVLEALYSIYGADVEHFIFDEIQNIPGWELFASRLRNSKKLILTGSNAKLLSGELATHLTGRHIDFTLHPFSFGEFLELKAVPKDDGTTRSAARTKAALREYMASGGFPETHLFGPEMVSRIYSDIVYKDVIRRHHIRGGKNFQELANYMVSNFAREITFRKLKEIFSVGSVRTIRDYVAHLESAYMVVVVERFSYKLKEQIKAPKKVYCIDTGIINSVSFKSSQDTGRLMENIVAVELQRRRAWGGALDIYYWKDHQQREVDFVVKGRGAVKELIQVCYASSADEIPKREFDSIARAATDLRCKNQVIITWEFEGTARGVRCVPLWKWLLTKEQTHLNKK